MKWYDQLVEALAKSPPGRWLILNVATYLDRKLLKWSRGRFSISAGSRLHDATLLLSTTGAKSGQKRETPLLYAKDGSDYVLIASRAGHASNPAWYFNLKKNPECSVTIRGVTQPCRAVEVSGEERERLWNKAVELYSGYTEYAKSTDRQIPVMKLSPI